MNEAFPYAVLLTYPADDPIDRAEKEVARFTDRRDAAAFAWLRDRNNIAMGGRYVAIERATRRVVRDRYDEERRDRLSREVSEAGHLGHGARLLDILASTASAADETT